jgi:hypothetical protein
MLQKLSEQLFLANQIHFTIMIWILFYVFVFVLISYFLIKLYEKKQKSKFYNVKTKEIIKGPSIFFIFWYLFTKPKDSIVRIVSEMTKGYGKIRGGFFFIWPLVSVCSAELAQIVFNDIQTFQHSDQISVIKYAEDFVGTKHLVSVNGDTWKKHRKLINPVIEALC